MGDVVDAKYSKGRWLASRVIQVDRDMVKIRFKWEDLRSDTWFERTDESLQPYRSWTKDNWRRRLIFSNDHRRISQNGSFYEVDGTPKNGVCLFEEFRDDFYRHNDPPLNRSYNGSVFYRRASSAGRVRTKSQLHN